MMYLDFEKPIVELETKIAELRALSDHKNMNLKDDLTRLERKVESVTHDIFSKLTVWERTQLSRHPQRPYMLDYVENAFDGFEELHGDRNFSDDPSLICGIATIDQTPMMVLGQQKGRSTKEKVHRNFGMPKPE
ncbi:MAG: acetyl-CoA carboxylase carboxyl transferase subunit alpha, partial [Deltaproteobacteria bacterium]|nr:acetyl-CoA carboxylase carboxyl transferase subunit alpha [Deltaproteobacteria bacterium]